MPSFIAQSTNKQTLFFLFNYLSIHLLFSPVLLAQDLPPTTPTIETIGAFSYIIPFDEEKQSVNQTNAITSIDFYGFNLKTYGLLYRLLDNGIPLKWVIRSGKNKEEADFTAAAQQIFPTTGAANTYNFVSSAFIIAIDDVQTSSNCEPNGDLFNFIDNIITDFGQQVSVYELLADTDMDVRYNLSYPPTIAVLNDGFSAYVHETVLDDAGLPYSALSSNTFFNNYSCYTFISQPHLEFISNNDYINSVQNFINDGGNFFAQCVAITTFENDGFFHTDDGLDGNFNENNNSYTYDYNDMAFLQFEGELAPGIHGSLSQYELDNGSDWLNNSYVGITNQSDEIIASSADWNGNTPGGNVFYLAGHDFEGIDIADAWPPPYPPALPSQFPLNQQHKRLYLNAAFIPANISFACVGNDACICSGETTTIGCSDASDDINYTWLPTTGLSCSDCPNPEASPTSTTTYTLTTNNNCSTASITVYVENIAPTASISGGGNLPCDNIITDTDIYFDFTGATPFTFSYAIDGIIIDTLTTTSNSYTLTTTIPGNYTLINLYDNSLGACEASISGSAIVSASGSFVIDLGPDTLLCEGETYLIDATYLATSSYQWQDQSTNATYTVTQAGIYSITLTDNDCQAIDSLVVNYLPNLITPNLGSDTLLCLGDSLVLNATMPNANNYTWTTGDTSATITIYETGMYGVAISNNCNTVYDSLYIDYIPPLNLATTNNYLAICEGDTLMADASTEGALNYLWSTNDTTTSITITSVGLYTCTISNSCEAIIDTFTVDLLSSIPIFNLAQTPPLCPNSSMVLDASTEGVLSYLWSTNESSPSISINESGTYYVTLTSECATLTDSLTIETLAPLNPIDLGDDINSCQNQTINLDATTIGANSYLWSTGDTLANISLNESGTYTVSVSNTCETLIDDIRLDFGITWPEQVFAVPNAFSPNNDGINDVFVPIPHPAITVNSYEFQLYDRWGKNILFTQSLNEAWEGNLSGETLELGVYVWFFSANIEICNETMTVFEKGNITLIR